MSDRSATQFDAIVIGGGPGGSTAAALLASRGRRVLLLERERFPRFHIGESLMPGTYESFERLGIVPRLEASDFPRKHSVQFITEGGKASRPFYFSEFYPLPMAVTWQVERAEFDRMLLERARECGAEVREGWSARDVVFEGERAVGVRAAPVEPAEATVEAIRSRVVIDASGQTALIARKLGLIDTDPRLTKAAVFAHYQGGIRDAGIDEGAILVVHSRGNRGWFWYIPLSRDRVSVGVVGDSKELLKKRGTPEEVLDAEIEESPEMRRRLAPARRLPPVRVLRDFSYRSRRCAGDGWVLVGDAFGFLDPVYSSGVLLATRSGAHGGGGGGRGAGRRRPLGRAAGPLRPRAGAGDGDHPQAGLRLLHAGLQLRPVHPRAPRAPPEAHRHPGGRRLQGGRGRHLPGHGPLLRHPRAAPARRARGRRGEPRPGGRGMRKLLYAAAAVLFVLHQDFWLWGDRRLLFGVFPSGFAYHVAYCLAASLLLLGFVRWAWPRGLEETGPGAPAGATGDRAAGAGGGKDAGPWR